MSRIAICDLLFTWPPSGGAHTDVKEIAERLCREHEVMLFVPDYHVGSFFRGKVDGKQEFGVTKVAFNHFTFSSVGIGKAFKEAVGRFAPDKVWITDGWHLKPYLTLSLEKFSPILRFYAYESLCLRSHGHCFCYGKICKRNYLHDPTYLFCLKCSTYWLRRVRAPEFILEFLGSGAFLPNYKNKVKRSIKAASSVIVYNDFIRDKLAPYNENIHTIPSGVDCKRFAPLGSEGKRQHDGEVSILMVGRTGDYLKGFSVLLEACRELRNSGVKLKLLITGDYTGAEDFIEPVGWLTQEKLPALYQRADICVVPSIWPEPFGIVAIEAMASGKPVIVTKVGGLGEIFTNGVEGFVVPPNSSGAIADRLDKLISSPKLRKEMGKAGQEKAKEYDWDVIFSKHYGKLFC